MRIFAGAVAFCAAGVAVLSAPCAVLAQTEATVSAQLVEAASGDAIGGGSVVVMASEDGEAVSAAIADEAGRLTVGGLAEGRYAFVFSAEGFAPLEQEVLIGARNQIYNLGRIALETADAPDSIVITGEARPDTVIDAGVYSFSIENNTLAQSGSTLDAMKGLPGVTIDQEGRVLLRGSDRVTILIDGDQSALTGIGDQSGLDSLPAANIARIEIINNPSARFGAAGSAGVINIVMKEGAGEGLSGDVGLRVGVGTLTKPQDDLPTDLGSFSNNPKITPFFNLNYGGEKADYFLQGEILFQDSLPNNEFTTRFYDDGRIILSQVPENREQVHYVFKAGMDRRLTPADVLSLSSVFDYESHTDRAQVPFIDAATGQRNRFWFWTEEEVTGHFSIDADYTHEYVEPGHELSARAEYIRGWEDEAYFLNEVSDVRVGDDSTHLIATEHTVPLTLDYTRPTRYGRLEVGSMVQFRWIPITYDVERGVQSVIYPGLGDESEWRENIYALYGNYVRETNRTVIEAGLRAEQTDVEYNIPEENIYYPTSDSYDYFRLFPNVRLTYKFTDTTDASFFYNNRVDRPGEPELRIFPKYDDPELLKVGNPYLRPQFTETFEVSVRHSWDGATASLAVYHRNIEDAFQRIFATDSSDPNYDIVNKIFQNTGNATNTGVEALGAYNVGDWLKLSGSANLYNIQIDPAELTLLFPFERPFFLEGSDDTTWDAKLNAEIALPGAVELQLTGVYYAERNIPQGRELARSSFDVGLSKLIYDEKVELSLTATDIFNDFGLEQELQGDDFTALYQNLYETQIVTAGVRYKF